MKVFELAKKFRRSTRFAIPRAVFMLMVFCFLCAFLSSLLTGLALSLCAYGDAESKLSLALKDCRLSFAKPQRELVRAAHVEALSMDGVRVEGVDGPCVRSWGDVAVPELRDFAGAEPNVVEADEPFRVNPI